MSRRRRNARRRGTSNSGARWLAGSLAVVALLFGWALTRGGAGPAATGSMSDAPVSNLTPVASGTVLSQSGVRVDAASVDFGRVPLDTKVAHAFRVTNEGATPVHLGRAGIAVLDGC